MAGTRWLQSRLRFVLVIVPGISAAILAIAFAVKDDQARLDHPAITLSAQATFAYWLLGTALLFRNHRHEVQPLARLVWSAGLALLLLHITIAFWRGHAWSHDAAVEHVAEVGGYGTGIFVNYLFALVWFLDVIWMWCSKQSVSTRSHTLKLAAHGFLAFVMFNATVVYGPSPNRYFYALAWLALAFSCWSFQERTSLEIEPPPGEQKETKAERE